MNSEELEPLRKKKVKFESRAHNSDGPLRSNTMKQMCQMTSDQFKMLRIISQRGLLATEFSKVPAFIIISSWDGFQDVCLCFL